MNKIYRILINQMKFQNKNINEYEENITHTLHSLLHATKEVILKIRVVIIKGEKEQRKNRIILDAGLQKSCIKNLQQKN